MKKFILSVLTGHFDGEGVWGRRVRVLGLNFIFNFMIDKFNLICISKIIRVIKTLQ